ncbi:hypothetical protein Tco_0396470 [Tanacetum coccineum]
MECLVDMIDMVDMDGIQLVEEYIVIFDCCKMEVHCRCWQLRKWILISLSHFSNFFRIILIVFEECIQLIKVDIVKIFCLLSGCDKPTLFWPKMIHKLGGMVVWLIMAVDVVAAESRWWMMEEIEVDDGGDRGGDESEGGVVRRLWWRQRWGRGDEVVAGDLGAVVAGVWPEFGRKNRRRRKMRGEGGEYMCVLGL